MPQPAASSATGPGLAAAVTRGTAPSRCSRGARSRPRAPARSARRRGTARSGSSRSRSTSQSVRSSDDTTSVGAAGTALDERPAVHEADGDLGRGVRRAQRDGRAPALLEAHQLRTREVGVHEHGEGRPQLAHRSASVRQARPSAQARGDPAVPQLEPVAGGHLHHAVDLLDGHVVADARCPRASPRARAASVSARQASTMPGGRPCRLPGPNAQGRIGQPHQAAVDHGHVAASRAAPPARRGDGRRRTRACPAPAARRPGWAGRRRSPRSRRRTPPARERGRGLGAAARPGDPAGALLERRDAGWRGCRPAPGARARQRATRRAASAPTEPSAPTTPTRAARGSRPRGRASRSTACTDSAAVRTLPVVMAGPRRATARPRSLSGAVKPPRPTTSAPSRRARGRPPPGWPRTCARGRGGACARAATAGR